MEKYANIIIGAGISGLICGGYLAKAGQKTLMLEARKQPGGRITAHRFGEYAFNLHGITHHPTMGRHGWVTAAEELGVKHHEQFVPASAIVWRRGKGFQYKYQRCNNMQEYMAFADAVSPEPLGDAAKKDLQKILEEVINWDFEKLCTELDNVLLVDFLEERTDDPRIQQLFYILTAEMIMMDVEDVKRFISAGKVWTIFRYWINKEGPFGIAGKGMDHQQALIKPFAEAFASFGGELLCDTRVREVLIEGDRVKGVLVGDREYLSDRVIVSCPLPVIPKIIKNLPPEIAEPVEDLKQAWMVDVDIFYGLNKKMTDEARYIMAMDPKDWSFLLGAQAYSLVFPWNAPEGRFSYWAERVYRKEDFDEKTVDQCYQEIDSIMEEMWPGFTDATVDKFHAVHTFLWHHQYSIYKKIPQKSESIDGLYFVGDCTAPQYGTGTDGPASTGVTVGKRILGI